MKEYISLSPGGEAFSLTEIAALNLAPETLAWHRRCGVAPLAQCLAAAQQPLSLREQVGFWCLGKPTRARVARKGREAFEDHEEELRRQLHAPQCPLCKQTDWTIRGEMTSGGCIPTLLLLPAIAVGVALASGLSALYSMSWQVGVAALLFMGLVIYRYMHQARFRICNNCGHKSPTA